MRLQTHYVIFFAFPLQHLLQERASVLRYIYCLFCYMLTFIYIIIYIIIIIIIIIIGKYTISFMQGIYT
jgi:hypothetical protein